MWLRLVLRIGWCRVNLKTTVNSPVISVLHLLKYTHVRRLLHLVCSSLDHGKTEKGECQRGVENAKVKATMSQATSLFQILDLLYDCLYKAACRRLGQNAVASLRVVSVRWQGWADYGRKDFLIRQLFRLQWKRERAIDNESNDTG